MTRATVEQLLAELYQADPSLREKEPVLRPLIAELLADRPDAALDPVFRERLKGQLRARMAQSVATSSPPSMSTKYSYGLIGGLIIAVLAIPLVYFANQPSIELAFAPEVKTVAQPEAFGPLSGPAGAASGVSGRGGGGAGGDSAAMSARPQSGGGGGGMSMPAGDSYTVPRFVYDGAIEPASGSVEVLARRKGQLSQGALSGLIGAFDLGDMLNLKSFPGMGLQSVNLMQDREYGYGVFIDFTEGAVSVNQNWMRWPNPYLQCGQGADPSCAERLRIRQDQMPSDADTIAIAGQFLRDHGISTEGYGAPEANRDWRIAYERAAASDRQNWYYPEQVMVTWPLMVNGMPVYEEGGAKAGLTVGVDVRTRKPVSVYGLTTQQYDASAYEGQADAATLKGALANGTYRTAEYGPGAVFTEVGVRAPVRGWMRTWVSDAAGTSREILVPALVFEITDVPAGVSIWQQAVVLPLAKELYTPQPVGYPMPLMEKAL